MFSYISFTPNRKPEFFLLLDKNSSISSGGASDVLNTVNSIELIKTKAPMAKA